LLKEMKTLDVWCNAWDMDKLSVWQARDMAPEGAVRFTIICTLMVDEKGMWSTKFHNRLFVSVAYYDDPKEGLMPVKVPLEKKLFGIDAIVGKDPVIEGWTDGRTWNGWDTPVFEREPFIKWLQESKIAFDLNDSGSITLKIEDTEPEEIVPFEGTVEGRQVWLYATSGWCWNEAEPQAQPNGSSTTEDVTTIEAEGGTDNGFTMKGKDAYIHFGKFDIRIQRVEDAMDNGIRIVVYPYHSDDPEALDDRTFWDSEADAQADDDEEGGE
jgi:hypothetical protein